MLKSTQGNAKIDFFKKRFFSSKFYFHFSGKYFLSEL